MSFPSTPALTLRRVLICGAFIVTLSMGIRHGFGLWMQPVVMERGWTRETYSLAMAVQNLMWGLAGPVLGLMSDRLGAYRVMVVGALLYALGLAGMAFSTTPLGFMGSAGVLIGVAQAGTTYAVVYGVIGRNVSAERRSWAMGVAAAAGSFGQFLMLPVDNALINNLGWQNALYILAACTLLIIPLAWQLREPQGHAAAQLGDQTVGHALREAFAHRSYLFLTAGYFVCGFQVVFIGVHLPSYLKDHGMDPGVATTALALIGLLNVIGTYTAGVLGQTIPKRYILSAIYGLRSVAIIVFLWVPLSPASVYVFAAVMGLLWLSTVPPTNAIVAQMFGVKYLAMLGGLVFVSHQIGSFLGVWLGGYLYELQGHYDGIWALCIALGFIAGALNLPIRESAVDRTSVPQAA